MSYIKENGEFEDHNQLFSNLEAVKLFVIEHYHKQMALNIILEYLQKAEYYL